MVVDRFKVRDDLTQRLAGRLKPALELSGGTAVVADMDDLESGRAAVIRLCLPNLRLRPCASWGRDCFR